jgi:predicted nucleic acid-binding protein
MNTREENSASPNGVLDVSILVPACYENPLKEHSVDFISKVLAQEKPVALPTSAILGAYHITTRYLGVPKPAAKRILEGILRTESPALYPHISPKTTLDALEYAIAYNIESWDGYLISLARSLGSTIIYTLDMELSKVKEITAVNPFPEDTVKSYHEYLVKHIKQKRAPV